jgi:hypothetical protein
MPDGIVAININPETGLREDAGGIVEYFFSEFPPRGRDDSLATPPGAPARDIRDQLL